MPPFLTLDKRFVCLACLDDCVIKRTIKVEDVFDGATDVVVGIEGYTCDVCTADCV